MTTTVDTACYVFGIVPADTAVPHTNGTGLASVLRLVPDGDIAAIVGDVPQGRSLGRAQDLLTHDEVLAELVAAGTPVLPMRFGAVLRDEDAVANELLRPHAGEFRTALAQLRGRVQYTLKVRYCEPEVLSEIMAERPDLARLRNAHTFQAQLRLGELIVGALEARRPHDVSALLADLPTVEEIRFREPAEPDDVMHAAFLVRDVDAEEFELRVAALGHRHAGRLTVRLVGPSAAYDFVSRG
jgi:hypothetical protein